MVAGASKRFRLVLLKGEMPVAGFPINPRLTEQNRSNYQAAAPVTSKRVRERIMSILECCTKHRELMDRLSRSPMARRLAVGPSVLLRAYIAYAHEKIMARYPLI